MSDEWESIKLSKERDSLALTSRKLARDLAKAQVLRESLKEMLRSTGDKEIAAKEMVEKLMGKRVKVGNDRLPNTGCDSDWEHRLSSNHVEKDTELGVFGTKSTGVLAVKTDGETCFYEKYLEEGVWKEHSVQYHLDV
ncbi:uncharacterized protein LOC120273110 [Dioscorea cayenensis subsp. rotundata]|uniref:Uncharacterized protein LOC120273110 n=1 Tax=Dioscorea cayennensis subsp. rotundata TaxID=55577 RepID=A0AB40C786_DIOCR|nr:uncharacterized protein LOC120273110 [Dioscorea cayenensis subsp. rotundata]